MSPEEHRDAAVQALKDVDGCPESPGEARVLTQAAIAHALLGLLELQLPERAMGRGCDQFPCGVQSDSGPRLSCTRDPDHAGDHIAFGIDDRVLEIWPPGDRGYFWRRPPGLAVDEDDTYAQPIY